MSSITSKDNSDRSPGSIKGGDPTDPSDLKTRTNYTRKIRSFLVNEIYYELPYMITGVSAMFMSSYTNQLLPKMIGKFIDYRTSAVTTGSGTSNSHTSSVLSSSMSTTNNNNNNSNIYMQIGCIIVIGGFASCIRTCTIQIAHQHIVSRLRTHLFTSTLIQLGEKSNDTSTQQQNEQMNDSTELAVDETASSTSPTSTDNDTDNDENKDSKKDIQASIEKAPTITPSYITSLITKDIDIIATTVTTNMINGIRNLSSTIFSLYNMLQINTSLVITTVTIIPIMGIGTITINKLLKRYIQQQQKQLQSTIEYIEERIQNYTLIQLYHRTNYEINAYEQLELTQNNQFRTIATIALLNGCRMGYMFISGSVTLFYIIHRGTTTSTSSSSSSSNSASTTSISGGQLTTFTSYAILFGLGVTGLLKSYNDIVVTNRTSFDNYFKIVLPQQPLTVPRTCQTIQNQNDTTARNGLTTTDNNTDNTSQSIDLDSITSIVIQNVSYSYPNTKRLTSHDATTTNTPSDNVVDDNKTCGIYNINITIPRGKVIALVGSNGCGKTTLVNILCGFIKPTTGNVYVTTRLSSSSELQYHELRNDQLIKSQLQNKIVQIIQQNTLLFNMSIYDNVRYSCFGNDDDGSVSKQQQHENILQALQDADCMKFIQSKEEIIVQDQSKLQTVSDTNAGIQYKVGMNGKLLSGGECQKLGLARGLVVNPLYMVLDEPATSIDTLGKDSITPNILYRNSQNSETKKEKRGILLITHDIRTLLDYEVDDIYVMKDGHIIEHGNFTSLRNNNNSELCTLLPKLYVPSNSK